MVGGVRYWCEEYATGRVECVLVVKTTLLVVIVRYWWDVRYW